MQCGSRSHSLYFLTAVALAACGGGDDETAAPVPVAQRFVTAEDAPGSKPDPVERRQTTVAFREFIAAISDLAVDPDEDEMTERSSRRLASSRRVCVDARFFGETHSGTAPHVVNAFIDLESEDGATSALDWLETDTEKPCSMSCAALDIANAYHDRLTGS